MIDYRHDKAADAIYIRLKEREYAYGQEPDAERRIDYAADGTPIGVELLCVSAGVNLRDLTEQQLIGQLLASHRIRVLAS